MSKITSGSAPEWTVTFLNNAGDVDSLTADSSAMWGGVTVAVDTVRGGTSEAVSGSFELNVSGNQAERVTVPHDASAAQVNMSWGRDICSHAALVVDSKTFCSYIRSTYLVAVLSRIPELTIRCSCPPLVLHGSTDI